MNRLQRTLLATGVFAVAAAGLGSGGAAAEPLAQYRWKSRAVLVFAPEGDPRLSEQIARFEAEGEARRDRDVVLVRIAGRTAQAEGGAAPDADALRRRFGIAEADFAVILVGKDGTEKRRADAVVDPWVFYDLIDTMPMRQDEMRRQG